MGVTALWGPRKHLKRKRSSGRDRLIGPAPVLGAQPLGQGAALVQRRAAPMGCAPMPRTPRGNLPERRQAARASRSADPCGAATAKDAEPERYRVALPGA